MKWKSNKIATSCTKSWLKARGDLFFFFILSRPLFFGLLTIWVIYICLNHVYFFICCFISIFRFARIQLFVYSCFESLFWNSCENLANFRKVWPYYSWPKINKQIEIKFKSMGEILYLIKVKMSIYRCHWRDLELKLSFSFQEKKTNK